MMQYGLIALIATCLVSGSDANAGSRVTTSWLLPSDGSYLEAANWSVGVPGQRFGDAVRRCDRRDRSGVRCFVRSEPISERPYSSVSPSCSIHPMRRSA